MKRKDDLPRMDSKLKALLLASAAGGLVLALVGWVGWSFLNESSPAVHASVRSSPVAFRASSATSRPVRFKWQFEGAPKMTLRQTGENDYAIAFPGAVTNFVFKVEGATGRTLRFSFEGVPAEHWEAIRPIVGYGDDLSDPAFFEPDEKCKSRWSYIESMTPVSATAIAYTHKFEADSAFVALRVPYTLDYQNRYFTAMPKQKGMEVITIGKSAEGRPLTLIKIGRGDEQAEKENPCILMYSREHGDEPDSSWVVQGAIRFLTGDSAEAQHLRKQFTFFFIPMLDPDACADALHTNIGDSFKESGKAMRDPSVYARWCKSWIESGRRLDLVLNFHNPEPRRYANVLCPRIERGSERKLYGRAFLSVVFSQMSALDLEIKQEPVSTGPSPGRFGNYLSICYGPLHVPFEVNSQNPDHRLPLSGLFAMGERFVVSATRFLSSAASGDLNRDIKKIRQARQAFLASGAAEFPAENALLAELRYQRDDDESLAYSGSWDQTPASGTTGENTSN